MQDYNIYLHATSEYDDSNKTRPIINQPVQNTNIDETTRDTSALDTFTKVKSSISSFASSGYSGLVNQGIAFLGKVMPAVALVYAIGKTLDSIVDKTTNAIETYTGHFQYSMAFNNYSAGIRNIMNPVSYTINQMRHSWFIQNENLKIEQNRTLVGSATMRNIKIGI